MNNKNNKVSLEYWLGGIMGVLFSAALTITSLQQIGLLSWRVAENEQTGVIITLFLIIGGLGGATMYLLSDKKKALIGIPAIIAVLAGLFFIPYGKTNLGMNAVNEVMAHFSGTAGEVFNDIACYVAGAYIGFLISLGIWMLNQHLVTRCATAVVTFAALMFLVFTDSTFNVFALMLMFAYICYVLLQFCASRSDKLLAAQSGERKRGNHDSTYISVCLITALIAALIPSSPDPIPWGEIGQRLRDMLTIDDAMISLSEDEVNVIAEGKLYIENEELAMVVNPVVVQLTDTLSNVENHVVGSVYDAYDGSEWTSEGVQTGTLSDDAMELAYFLSRNEVEDLSFLDLKKARFAVKNPMDESAFTMNKSIETMMTGTGYTMLNIGDNHSFFYITDGYADDSYIPDDHPVYTVTYLSLDWTDPQLISMLRKADSFRYNSPAARNLKVTPLDAVNTMFANTSVVTSAQGYSSSLSFGRTFREDSVERAALIREQYTQLPQLPSRVKELARTIVGKTTGTYDTAQLLAGYLASNYTYTGEAPDVGMDILGTDVSGTDLTFGDLTDQLITDGTELDLNTSGDDAVDTFLFETQSGSSAEFASALTVMLRSLGIPARYVEGYYINHELDNTYYPALPYAQVAVLNKQAHAWVEYYIEGFGWIPVDPVPGFEYVSAATASDKYSSASYLYADHQEVALILSPKTLSGDLYSFGENHLVSQTLDTFDGSAWTQGSTEFNDSTYYDALEFAYAMSRFTITTDSAFLFEYDIDTRAQNNLSLTMPAKTVSVEIANRSFEVDMDRGNLYIDPESYTYPPEYSAVYLSIDWQDERIKQILRDADSFDYDDAVAEGDQPTTAGTKALLDVLGVEEINFKNSTLKIDNTILPQFVPGGGKTELEIYNSFDAEHYLDFYARRANDFDVRYTQLPNGQSAETLELAQTITASAGNTYDKALAIEQYLKENFVYTGNAEDVGVPEAYKQLLENPDLESDDLWDGIYVPAEDVVYSTESTLIIEPTGENYVDAFLASGEGDSTAFASAMTVMLRSLGIPARYVEGYYVNELLSKDVYERLDNLQYIVISQNEHAWVEVYFEGIGWVPFDPSPEFEYVSQYTSNKALYGVVDQQNIEKSIERMEEERAAAQAKKVTRIVIITVICVLIAALITVIAVPNIQRALRRRRMVEGRNLDYRDRLGLRLVDDIMCELALGGLARNADETIIAYCDRVCQELWLSENIRSRLAHAIEYMDEMCYSTEITHPVKPTALRFLYGKVHRAVIKHIGFFKRIFRFLAFNHWTQERYSAGK